MVITCDRFFKPARYFFFIFFYILVKEKHLLVNGKKGRCRVACG